MMSTSSRRSTEAHARARVPRDGRHLGTPRRIHPPDVARTRGIGSIPYTVCWCVGAWTLLVAILIRRDAFDRDLLCVEGHRSGRVDQLARAGIPPFARPRHLPVRRSELPHGAPGLPRLPDDHAAERPSQLPFRLSARDPSALRHSRVSVGPSGSDLGCRCPSAAAAGLRALGLSARWIAYSSFGRRSQRTLGGQCGGRHVRPLRARRWPANSLVASTVFKLYNAVTLLWVVRERRRRRQLGRALAAAIAVAAVTLVVSPVAGVNGGPDSSTSSSRKTPCRN